MNGDNSTQQLHESSSGLGGSTSNNPRDAFNQRGSGSEPNPRWKNEPTPISVPANRLPKHTSKFSNPYSGRMSDNLTGSKQNRQTKSNGGNLTASRTILSMEDISLKKARRRHPERSGYHITRDEENQDAFRSSKPEVVEIPSDEDTGELTRYARTTSPDPIDSIDEDDAVTRSEAPELSNEGRRALLFERPKRALPKDGDSTRRLGAKIERVGELEVITIDDEDDTEEQPATEPALDDQEPSKTAPVATMNSTSPPRPSSSYVNTRHTSPTLAGWRIKGKVAEQIKLLNEKSQPANTSRVGPVSNTARRRKSSLDEEVRLPLPSPAAGGIMHRMKPKAGRSMIDYAAQSSKFFSANQEKSDTKDTGVNIVLLLQAWYRGHEGIKGGDKHFFSCDGNQIWIKRGPATANHIINFKIPEHFGIAHVTSSPVNPNFPVIIKLMTGKATKNPNLDNAPYFIFGTHGPKGTLSFRFNTQHPSWEGGKPYEQLSAILQKSIDRVKLLNGNDAQLAWSTLFSEDMDEEKPSPKRISTSDADSATVGRESVGPSTSRSVSYTSPVDDDPPGPLASRVTRRTTVKGNAQSEMYRRTTRSTGRSLDVLLRDSPPLDSDELILVYPSSGHGAIDITRGDIKRLEPGQYLNDTLIEFGLKLWLNDVREKNPELAEQVYVFSSFFYKKLAVRDKQDGYHSVRKWTSKIDLFKKKYIIVPINEHLHWYLAIICNPEYVLHPPAPKPLKASSSIQTRKRKREFGDMDESVELPLSDTREATPIRSRSASEADETSVEALLDGCAISQSKDVATPPAEEPSLPVPEFGGLMYPSPEPELMDVDVDLSQEDMRTDAVATEQRSASAGPIDVDDALHSGGDSPRVLDSDDAPMEVDTAFTSSSSTVPAARFYSAPYKGKGRALSPEVPHPPDVNQETETREPVEPEPIEADFNKPWIFTFDSLGSKHPAAIANLKNYLQLEAQDKKGLDPANTTEALGKMALVPAQPNFCDCGIYLIHFVQTFMKDPKKAMEIIFTKKSRDYSSREREQDWDAEAVGIFREELLARTRSLRDLWKLEKAAKEEMKRREAAEAGPSATTSEGAADSDDDIIVGEVIMKSRASNARGKGKARVRPGLSTVTTTEETKASRLR